MLNLGFLYAPRTANVQYQQLDDKQYLCTANGQNGQILSASLVSTPSKGSHRRFKTSIPPGVNQYEWRVRRLQWVLHSIVEYGLGDKVYRSLKRLHLIAFTCNRRSFLSLTRKVALGCQKGRSRNPLRLPPRRYSYKYPSLTGETKSVYSLNGVEVHLWTYKKLAKVSNTPWSDTMSLA